MAIVAADIECRYSGGSGNTSAAASLGGAISTAGGGTIDDNVANDLFDDVSSAEQAVGDVEYRGAYWKNNHGTLALTTPKLYITSQAELAIAVADEAKNTTIETIADETAAPVGPSFSSPTTFAGGLAFTDLSAADYRGFWVRRTIGAGAASGTRNTETLVIEGSTL